MENVFFSDKMFRRYSSSKPFDLRPYQEECISTSLNHLSAGLKRVAVSLPVGSGKTVIFTQLVKRWTPTDPRAKKVLILAHRKELLFQPYR